MPIEPALFYRSLVAALEEHREEVAKSWDSYRDYTQLILGQVLPDVGRRIGLTMRPTEWYTIDRIYCDGYDTEHFPSLWNVPKSIEVAVEHENNSRGSCDEMIKLQMFNAPLKVLITYVSSGLSKENVDKEIAGYLGKYEQIIKNADIFQDAATLRRQLGVCLSNRFCALS